MGSSASNLRLPSVVLFALVAALSQQARGAISLVPFSPTDDEIKVFTTEVKRDENVNSNSQRGHDVFLRNQEAFAGPSFNLDWGASGTAYDWLLSYGGDEATFTFAGRTLRLDVVPDLRWERSTSSPGRPIRAASPSPNRR